MEFNDLFQRYWWLIFPILSMVWGMVDQTARHRRAREGMHLIKSYIDQGKEPPPALLKFLETKTERDGLKGKSGWSGVFLFAALAGGFVMLAWWPGMGFEPRQIAALHFVALVMGGLGLGCLVGALRREQNRQ